MLKSIKYSVLILLFFPIQSFSQELQKEKSTAVRKKEKIHPPGLAMAFSACVPGLGQAYNKKFWKIPIVYAAMGTTVYFVNTNNKYYKGYRDAYLSKTDTTLGIIDNYPDYSKDHVKELQEYHRKYRDLNLILTALFYSLNIIDAYVDAHLMKFDVSDDLSMTVSPNLNSSAHTKNISGGLTLSLKF